MRLRRLDVRSQEGPGALGPLVLPVVANVAPPDDVRASCDERRDETRRLRVVYDHDVSLLDFLEDGIEVGRERSLVDRPLAFPKVTAIAGPAVEAVVESFGHSEELVVASDHQPVRLEPHPTAVAEQRRKHLRHAAAVSRRVDVEDAPTADQRA